MHEKTLLYGALGFTALAAIYGVVHTARSSGNATTTTSEIQIAPVALVDQKTLSSTEVPIRLTASDGTGLRLQALKANAVVEDPLALTELHLTFENPESRILEGTFRITLPQGASLSRFAMKVNGIWQEGEVVEKQAARQAYEDFLHRKQDPALMEQGAGNEFSARVFPIPANGVKEIVIAYSETMEAGAPYVLPLRGLPQLGALDIDVHAAGARGAAVGGRSDASYSLHQQRFTPGQDFIVEGNQLPHSGGLRAGDLAIARIVPFGSSRPEPVSSAVLLVDTSASRGLGLADQAKLVRNMIGRLSPDATIVVGAFDQEVAPIYEGKASGFGDNEQAAIVARGALGASDLEQAIAWAGDQAKRTKAKRVVIVGDGVATAGETDAQKLKTKVEALRSAGVDRMDAIAVGGIRDDAFFRTIVRGVLDRDGVVLDAKLGDNALARRLGEATSSGVPIKIEGAAWSWPRTLDGLQAGDEVMVYAQLDAGKAMKITVGTQEITPDLRASDRPLVERAWAQAKISSLVEAPTESAATTKSQIIALSTQHRVLSPFTAMLVLERDSDYARFGIDRNAKLDILTVQDGRIALDHESRATEADRTQAFNDQQNIDKKLAPEKAKEETKAGAPAPRTVATATPDRFAAPMASAAPVGRARGADTTTTTPPAEPESSDGIPDPAPAQGAVADAPVLAGHGAGGAPGGVAGGVVGGVAANGPSGGDLGGRPSATGQPETGLRDESRRGGEAPHAPEARPVRPPPPPRVTTIPPMERQDPAPRGQVRAGALVVQNGIAQDEAQRVVRAALPRLRGCYTSQTPIAAGHADVAVVVDATGEVESANVTGVGAGLQGCVSSTFKRLTFPAPGTGTARFTASFDFIPEGGDPNAVANNAPQASPYDGRFKIVMDRLQAGDKDGALDEAKRWETDQPGDIMALVALGEAYEAKGDVKTAARAYGSILELFSFRADSRRFAGERLERLHDPAALKLAADTYGKAAEQRPDHPASHRLYAYTLLKAGDYEKAFEAMKKGASRSYPAGRFLGADRILKEDLGLIASAWAANAPTRRGEIMDRLHAAGGHEENAPSLRFVLVWETDANDVDFHIHDARGGHAYYSQPHLGSGGDLYADVTTGYGPECFTIRGTPSSRAYPYTLQAHYYSRGPMGYGMGKLEVLEHDGKGHLTFDERPFVVMKDHAFVDLGTVDRGKLAATAMK